MNATVFDIDHFVALEDKESIPPPALEATMGYSFVTQQLAQGSAPPPGSPMPFDMLVLTAMEYQLPQAVFSNVVVVHVPLDDAKPSQLEVARAMRAARTVSNALRRGQRVLTTCFMGWNRSGLVNGLALIDLGWNSADAIEAIRQARGENALSNTFFVEVLNDRAMSLGRGRRAELA